MRTLIALLVAVPLLAAAQAAPPPEAPAAPLAQPAPPPPPSPPPPYGHPAQPPPYGHPAQPPPYAYPAQPSPPAFAHRPPGRDTWYIGFGLGSGGGNATSGGVSDSLGAGLSGTTTAFVNFKVGATLSPKLLLGFDLSALRTAGTIDTGFGTINAASQISNYDAMVTWFPMERGLFLRGGAGLSIFSVDASGAGGSSSDSVNGVNLTVGAGYAFWLGRSFNLTVNLDYSGQSYSSSKAGAPSRSNYAALWLGFDWY